MLANDALDARREGRISTLMLMSCGCTVMAWALALGIVLIAIASSGIDSPGAVQLLVEALDRYPS